jgi:hypothetical protein
MFSLLVSILSIFLVVFIGVATINAAFPEQLNNVLYFVAIFMVIPLSLGFISCIKNNKHYKKVIQEKQKKVKMLKDYEVKDYIIECLDKREIYLKDVKAVIEVLKIGKIKRTKLETDIVYSFQKKKADGILNSVQHHH